MASTAKSQDMCGIRSRLEGEVCGIPHLAKNERDAPNFLYAALDRTVKFREPTRLPRKFLGMWSTRRWVPG